MGDLKIDAMLPGSSNATSGETTLQVCMLTPTERAAQFFLFLRSAAPGAAVQLEPLDATCYRFTVSASPESLVQVVLQSAEFFPSLIRIEASGELEIRLAAPGVGAEMPIGAAAAVAPAPPVEATPAYGSNGSNGVTAHEDSPSMPAAEVSTPDQAVEGEDTAALTGALERLDRRVGELLAGLDEETATPTEDIAPVSSNGVSAASSSAVEQQDAPALEPEHVQAQAEVASEGGMASAGEEPAEEAPARPNWEWTPQAPTSVEPQATDAATGDAQAPEDSESEVEPGRIEVVAHPFTSFNTLDRFVTLVSALPDVRAVALKRFRNGTLRLAVDYDGAAPLVDHLKTIHEIPIEVVHDDGALIELAVQEAAVEAPSL